MWFSGEGGQCCGDFVQVGFDVGGGGAVGFSGVNPPGMSGDVIS